MRPFSVIRVSSLDANPFSLMKVFHAASKAAEVTKGGRPEKLISSFAAAACSTPDTVTVRVEKLGSVMLPL